MIVRKDKIYSFGKILKDSEKIKEEFMKCIEDGDRLGKVIQLVRDLRKRYKPRVKKTKSVTMWSKKIEDFKKRGVEFNQEEFTRFMRQSSNEGYHSYLKELPKLKQDNNAKEYYSKLRFYSAIDKNTGLLTELSEKKEEGDEENARKPISLNEVVRRANESLQVFVFLKINNYNDRKIR